MITKKTVRKDPLLLQAPWIWAIMALLLAAGWKAWLVAGDYLPFNADEAVVSLMARHILQGKLPVFFYGQSYMGSLDAYLIALGFSVLGESVWVIRLVQGLLYLAVILTSGWIGKLGYGSWTTASITMLLLAIPTVNVTLYTTVTLGDYVETLLIGNLLILLALSLYREWFERNFPGSFWKWACIGFLSGFGLWVFGLSLIFSAAVILFLLVAAWRMSEPRIVAQSTLPPAAPFSFPRLLLACAVLAVGALAGSSPWWIYAAQHGLASLVGELGGSAIAGVEGVPYLQQVWAHVINLVLFGSTVTLGFRPTSHITWLALPLLPFVLLFWLWVFGKIFAGLRTPGAHRPLHFIILNVVLLLICGFVLTSFGADPSGRYFVPLAVPLALWAAWSIVELRRSAGRRAYLLVGLLLLYHAWGTFQCAGQFPPGITTQFYQPSQIDHRYDDELVEFLLQHGENYGYTHYWVSYPLAFLSQERLIFVPHLPYHPDFRYTQRDDRYAAYTSSLEQAQRVAYITSRQPALQRYLREKFTHLDIAWQEQQIGDYLVFYQLSRVVRPTEIGLGRTTYP